MKVTINANGTTIQAEISEEQLKELGLIEEQPTGYERVKKGDVYYFNITRSRRSPKWNVTEELTKVVMTQAIITAIKPLPRTMLVQTDYSVS